MSHFLVIDDDLQILEVLSEMLKLEGHTVTTASDGKQAAKCLTCETFDLVITDLIMPEKEGLETIADLRQEHAGIPIIAISGGGRIGPMNYLETATGIGADATLAKPFARDELISVVNHLLSRTFEEV
ncbi:MAG: response regulator [Gammaproteobacteria bacterium]|nr:response regulator [Gammaproteobacteria bacterium]